MNNVQPSSIFNEVYGPVMIGPSSSHTAGPARIGMMINYMLTDTPESIRILLDEDGSFAAQYEAQGSNFGFIGGILGIDISDEQIKRSMILADEQHIAYEFVIEKLPGFHHPNFTQITVKSADGSRLTVEAASTGGGTFKITRYQDYEVLLRGDMYELLIEFTNKDSLNELERLLKDKDVPHRIYKPSLKADSSLVQVSFDQPPSKSLIEAIERIPTMCVVCNLKPVVPVVKQINGKVPFLYAEQAEAYAQEHNLNCYELALKYEGALSGKNDAQVQAMAAYITEIMRDSAEKAIEGNYRQRGFLPPSSTNMAKHMTTGVDLGVLNQASVWAAGVMEYDICMGRVVAAPTGGSSGVLPGAVISVGTQMEKSAEEIAQSILVGGLIGVFIDHKATFAAEIAACQAENGAASAMAAAAVSHMLGGTVTQCFNAASLALQNMLGLICDPVAGTGNVPCVGRNSAAVANALVSSNMVLWGFNPAIPLDEVIETMLSVGEMLPAELKCTGKGGLCTTKTAINITKNLDLTPFLD